MPQDFYEFHGLSHVTETIYTCPWCGKDKFNVNPANFQYRCFGCEGSALPESSGNPYSFLKRLSQESAQGPCGELSKDRMLEQETLRVFGVGPHPLEEGSYFFPIFNGTGSPVGSYKVSKSRGKWRLYCNPKWPGEKRATHPVCPIKPDHAKHKGVFIMEGHWDAMTMVEVLGSLRSTEKGFAKVSPPRFDSGGATLLDDYAVIGLPGASTLCLEELRALVGQLPVIICFDNDAAGDAGLDKLQKEFIGAHLVWPKDPPLPDKYDISDLVRDQGKSQALEFILANLGQNSGSGIKTKSGKGGPRPMEMPEIVPEHCPSFVDLLAQIGNRSEFHFDRVLTGALAFSTSVFAVTELPGDQLWARLIGPPGTGKTTAVKFFFRSPYVHSVSEMRGMHSGYIGDEDASLIPVFDRKTVVVPDADVILSSPSKDKILSELRDIYDGQSSAAFRNGIISRYWNLRMSFLLCGTASVRSLNKAHLGERFLDYDITEGNRDRRNIMVASAMRRAKNLMQLGPLRKDDAGPEEYLERIACGFLKQLKEAPCPVIDLERTTASDYNIGMMAEWAATLRSMPAEEDEKDELESPTRISTQLQRSWYGLHWVFNQGNPEAIISRDGGEPRIVLTDTSPHCNTVYDILKKLTRDTAHSLSQNICFALAKRPYTVFELEDHLHRPVTTLRTALLRMQSREVITRTSKYSGGTGRNPDEWTLTKRWAIMAESLMGV